MQMRSTSLPFILLGTMFTAGGYGGTLLISAWFRAQGGSDIDTGKALSLALVGTLLGVPLVGWCAGKIDAARLAAVAALRPVIMVGLGGAVFSGMMAFQVSLTAGTRVSAGTFSLYMR